jgi:queuine/archaeosine tRNA-ribosyltransferase
MQMSALAGCSSAVTRIIFALTMVSSSHPNDAVTLKPGFDLTFGSACDLRPAHYSPCTEQKTNDMLGHELIVNADQCTPVIDTRATTACALARSSDGLARGCVMEVTRARRCR